MEIVNTCLRLPRAVYHQRIPYSILSTETLKTFTELRTMGLVEQGLWQASTAIAQGN